MRAGYDPASIRPVDAVSRKTAIPVLVEYGDADTLCRSASMHSACSLPCHIVEKEFLSAWCRPSR